MGRKMRRVPFDIKSKYVWPGYLLDPIPCFLCGGTGVLPDGETREALSFDGVTVRTTEYCSLCEGDGVVHPKVEVPKGHGYQMWETTSEGSAMSPVFHTKKELANWLAETGASIFGQNQGSFSQWMSVINASEKED